MKMTTRWALAFVALLFTGSHVLAEGFDESYEIKQGDFDNNGYVDLYVYPSEQVVILHSDINIPIKGLTAAGRANGDIILLQQPDGSFLVDSNIEERRLQAQSAPFAVTGIMLTDYNGDGNDDLVLLSTPHPLVILDGDTIYSVPFLGFETVKYEYDALGRLIEVHDRLNGVRQYKYDKAGNRTSVASEAI